MADAHERPTSVTALPAVAAVPDPPPVPDTATDQPYRPMSLLAILGFVLAVLYAALVLLGGLAPLAARYPKLLALLFVAAPLVGVQLALLRKSRERGTILIFAGWSLVVLATILGLGGLVAFSGTTPWLLLQTWGWLLVGGAALLCWLARSQIAASEGTLDGAALAGWGITICLFFGLMYGAYLTSNSFAVRGQARQIAEEFLQHIQDTKDPDALQKAFLLGLPLRSRPVSDIQRSLEIEYNQSPDGRALGSYSRFRNSPFVVYLRTGPCKVNFERTERVVFERGGYEVALVYSVECPMGSFEMQVPAFGQDTTSETMGSRRQWNVLISEVGMAQLRRKTDEELKREASYRGARELVYQFLHKLRTGHLIGAYLDTLPGEQRQQSLGIGILSETALSAATGLTLAGSLGGTPELRDQFRKGLEAYEEGAILDSKNMFAASESAKKQMIAEAREHLTRRAPGFGEFTMVDAILVPNFTIKGDRIEYSIPAHMMTWDLGKGKASHLLECDILVEAPLSSKPTSAAECQIRKIILRRGQTAPNPRGSMGVGT